MNKKNVKLSFKAVIDHFGGQNALASKLGTSQAMISWWLNASKKIPPERAIQIEEISKGKFNKGLFRPDLWPLN